MRQECRLVNPLPTGTTIRAARGDDFEAVTALLEKLGRATVTDDTTDDARWVYRQQVVDPSAHHMVVEAAGGEIVAFCSLHFRTRLNHPTEEAWIPDLIVAEHARQSGIALALLEEAERRALERGCWHLTLESGHQRAEAHALYRRFRMRDAGRYFSKSLTPDDRS
jgi:GNAT superfamily N-acetyltransferase